MNKNHVDIWGDFEYDDENPDAELWGDADEINTGNGRSNNSKNVNVWAGDGNDKVTAGDSWNTVGIWG